MKCSSWTKLKLSPESIFREWRFFRQLKLIYIDSEDERKQKKKRNQQTIQTQWRVILESAINNSIVWKISYEMNFFEHILQWKLRINVKNGKKI